jgi:hypothetical protein
VKVFFNLKYKVLSFAFSKYNYKSPSYKKNFSLGFAFMATAYPGRLLSLRFMFNKLMP